MFADVRRGLAIAAVVEAATVTDTDGNTIDTSEFFGRRGQADEVDEADEAEEAEGAEETEGAEAPDEEAE
jgi:trigger factor